MQNVTRSPTTFSSSRKPLKTKQQHTASHGQHAAPRKQRTRDQPHRNHTAPRGVTRQPTDTIVHDTTRTTTGRPYTAPHGTAWTVKPKSRLSTPQSQHHMAPRGQRFRYGTARHNAAPRGDRWSRMAGARMGFGGSWEVLGDCRRFWRGPLPRPPPHSFINTILIPASSFIFRLLIFILITSILIVLVTILVQISSTSSSSSSFLPSSPLSPSLS